MSGAQTYAGPNVLFDPMLAGRMQSQQNTLMQQQQELTDHDVAMTGQAAAPLLNMSEEDAAAAYPGWLQDMQRQGLAKYAPPTYPGHAATQALVQRAIPLVQQYNLGIMVPPGLATALQGNQPPAQGGQPPAQGGAAGGGQGAGDINSLPKAQFLQAVALRESGGDPAALNYVAKADPTAYARGATASGKYQMVNSTWQQAAAWAGVDTSKYPTAMSAPESVQDQVASALYDHQGTSPWQKGPKDWIKDEGGRYQLATVRPPPGAPGGAPSTQPPGATVATAQPATAPPGTAPQDGRYQVASNAPVAPPGSTAPSGKQQFTYANGKVGGQPDAQGGVQYTDGSYGTPPAGRPVPVAPAAPPASTAPPGQPPAAPAAPVVAQGSQPPAPPSAQPPASTAAASRANLPHYTDIPTGQNSPQYQEAQRIQQQIGQLMPYAALPAAKAKIAQLQAQQQLLMQTDSVVQTQEGPYHPLTGVLDEPRKPLPNYVYNPNAGGPGVPGFVDTTGTNKPEFEPAQRDAAVAQRTVMDLGPKIAAADAGTGPPVSPEDRGRYAVAAETYVQPVLRESKVSGETVRVPTRELPPGFPKPTGLGGPGASGGSNVVIPGYSPAQQEIERDPTRAKVADQQYDRDSKEIAAIGDAGRQAQADQVRITQMQDVLQRFSSGAGTEARTAASAWLQRWLPSAITGWEKTSANLSGADAAQEFQKLALTGAGTQERSVLGNRGGFQAIRMFQAANPNVSLQDATNKSILDMQLITNQANQDYSQAALSHFAEQEQRYGDTHKYTSLAQFDRTYNQQRNPQVYAAAMGAVAGQPPEQWAKGLSDAEYARALKVVENAKPGAVVNGKSGRIVVQPPTVTPPPGYTVVPQ